MRQSHGVALAAIAVLTIARTAVAAGSWLRLVDPGFLPPAAVALTPDEGLLLGATASGTALAIALAKLDALGAIEWQTRMGTAGDLIVRGIVRTADGGYAIGGASAAGAGSERAFVVRLDAAGTELWRRSFVARSEVESIDVTEDGGLVIAGGLDVAGTGSGAWVARLDPQGALLWSHVRGSAADRATCVRRTADDGAVVIGDAGCPGTNWVLRLDASGTAAWRSSYIMFEGSSLGRAIVEVPGSGFAMAGARSGPGPLCGPGNTTGFLVRLDATGGVIRRQVYASPAGGDLWTALSTTSDGGFLLAGTTEGQSAAVVAKVDSLGALVWQRKLPAMAEAEAAFETIAGDTVLAGVRTRAGSEVFVAHLDQGLASDPACGIIDASLATSLAPVMPFEATTPATDVAALDAPVATTVEAGVLGSSAVCPAGCSVAPGVLAGLLAVRQGADVRLQWTAGAGANGYNVWYVTGKSDIDRARQATSPPAFGVSGCSVPDPAPAATCTDASGVTRAPETFYYQVRSFCNALSEGP